MNRLKIKSTIELLILFALSIFVNSISFAHENNSQKQISRGTHPNKLFNFLLSPLPNYQDVQGFFNNTARSSQQTDLFNNYILESKEFAPALKLGREFRLQYIQWLNQDIGESNLEFITSPVVATLKKLRNLPPDNLSNAEREMPEPQASRQAFTEMLKVFGLPNSTTLNTLDSKKRTDPMAFHAFEYYKKRYFRLQMTEVPQNVESKPSVDIFKRRMKKFLEDLRIQNFKSQLRRLSQRTSMNFHLISSQGQKQTLNIGELLNAEIEWLNIMPKRESLSELYPFQTFKMPGLSIVNWLFDHIPIIGRAWDWDIAKRHYEIHNQSPIDLSHGVEIRIPNGQSFVIGGKNFSDLLNQLTLPNTDDLQSGDSALKRYLYEGAGRDKILADTVTLMFAKKDPDLEYLESRLQTRIHFDNPKFAFKLSSTLTQELQQDPGLLFRKDALNELRFSGYAVHPNHWRIRDHFSQEAASPHYSEFNLIDPLAENSKLKSSLTKSGLKKKKKSERKERIHSRMRSHSKTIRNLIAATAVGSVALMTMGSWYTVEAGMEYAKPTGEYNYDVDVGEWEVRTNEGGKQPSEILAEVQKKIKDSVQEAIDYIKEHFKDTDKESSDKAEDESTNDSKKFKMNFSFKGGPKFVKSSSMIDRVQHGNWGPHNKPKANDGGFNWLSWDWEKPPRDPLFYISNIRISENELPTYFNILQLFNLPLTLKYDSWDFKGEPFPSEKLELQDESANADFTVSSPTYYHHENGRVPIVLPSGFIPVWMELEDANGNLLTPNSDFKAYHLPYNRLIYAEVTKDVGERGPFKYRVGYAKDKDPNKHLIFDVLNVNKIRAVNKELIAAGFIGLSNDIENYLKRTSEPNLEELTQVFANSGFYTYSKEKPIKGLKNVNEFSEFAKYLREDKEFYYQCTSSNMVHQLFFKKYFELLLKLRANPPNVLVEGVVGFVRKPKELIVTEDTAHYHGNIGIVGVDRTFIETDATPVNMDPDWKDYEYRHPLKQRKTPISQNPLPNNPNQEAQRLLPMISGRELRLSHRAVIRNESKSKTENEAFKIHQKNLNELRKRRFHIQEAINQIAQKNPNVDKHIHQLTQLPGTRVIGIALIIYSYGIREDSSEMTLKRLSALKLNIPPFAKWTAQQKMVIERFLEKEKVKFDNFNLKDYLNALLTEENNKYKKWLLDFEKWGIIDTEKFDESLSFLGDEALVEPLLKLIQFLSLKSWDPPLEFIESTHVCETILTTDQDIQRLFPEMFHSIEHREFIE